MHKVGLAVFALYGCWPDCHDTCGMILSQAGRQAALAQVSAALQSRNEAAAAGATGGSAPGHMRTSSCGPVSLEKGCRRPLLVIADDNMHLGSMRRQARARPASLLADLAF